VALGEPNSAYPFSELSAELAALGRTCYARGWLPATSGNLSARIDAQSLAITASGRDKGALSASDILRVDMHGKALSSALQPSAETALHCQIYQRFPDVGAVLHTHSRAATVLSRAHLGRGALELSGYELAKALSAVSTHEVVLRVPVVENHQDMRVLGERVAPLLTGPAKLHGYLIAGHGLYTWGKNLPEAFRHLEALEFLLECALWEGRAS
jgi:methylthioribulose-1-phosphate dehydratase